ncbi:FN3 associated domain-containing protein [Treponema zioleckii]|uniref:FN3 associated domain-containing protein n=1 Tax=Treponema zioleckii TaxID=331680 RepID=UPI00168A8EF4|nr:FN3 associated domain-containing protein [Treponema zioleckii]
MKALNKIFAGMLMATAAFGFFGCSDETEDENLVVEFTVSGSDSDSSRTVTLTKPEGYEDKDVQIIYTLDESTPEVTFNQANYTAGTNQEVAEYIDYGTASLYDSPITVTSTVTINAYAFYIDTTNQKCVKSGDWSTKKVTVASTTGASTTVSDSIPSTAVTFNLASTGNSITTKYFDTSNTNVFKYGDKNAYYQTQFSWKGTGKGNWYLYMREVGGGMIKNGSDTFIAKGTYSGTAFDKKSVSEITPGEVKLVNSTGSTENTITIANDNSFTLKVNGVNGSGSYSDVYVGDAK